ncbi:MAG: helix-turn-helix domain-containing protein [Butyrivibrio sp.]|nr:helix-turn-helix domain-containing protein [Butyrivibrio sp.]
MARNKIKNVSDQREFIMIYQDFLESDLLTAYEKIVFIALKKFANSNNQCFPSLQKIADVTQISIEKIQDILKSLEQKHVISIENRAGADGRSTDNLYTLYDFKELWDAGNSGEETAAVTENPTDEFIKVSKYLNTIFAYNNIPLHLVPISLLMAQEMEFKTNIIYLLKPKKEKFAQMLDVSPDRVKKLIQECCKYNIIRPVARATYEVNSYLFSTGSILETRMLQAHFDFDADRYVARAELVNPITGAVVRKAVYNKKDKQIPGQMTLPGLEDSE